MGGRKKGRGKEENREGKGGEGEGKGGEGEGSGERREGELREEGRGVERGGKERGERREGEWREEGRRVERGGKGSGERREGEGREEGRGVERGGESRGDRCVTLDSFTIGPVSKETYCMLDLTTHLVFPVASHTNYTSSVPHPQASSLPFVTEVSSGSMHNDGVGRTDRNTQIVLFIFTCSPSLEDF